MIRRSTRAFRPDVEGVEARALTTGGFGALLAREHARAEELAVLRVFREQRFQFNHAAHVSNVSYPNLPGVGPGLGFGLLHLELPFNYNDYGVVSVWNNTNTGVALNVSASTFDGGAAFPFVLRPGAHNSFFAPVVNGQTPVFTLNFGGYGAPVALPMDNLVFVGPGYVPDGTAGWPYAINLGPNGYTVSAI